MYKISIYGCAMFKKLVCQWVNKLVVFDFLTCTLYGSIKNKEMSLPTANLPTYPRMWTKKSIKTISSEIWQTLIISSS